MRQILLATQNPGKIAELRTLLANLPIEVLGLDDLGLSFPEPPETGTTFEDNAALKALTYAQWTGLPSMADDSGLEVDSLAGNPGVNSAWYAYSSEAEAKAHPRHIRDPANCTLLLTQLADTAEHLRTARFVCCMALAAPHSINTPQSVTTKNNLGGRLPAAQNDTQPSPRHSRAGNLPHQDLPNQTYHITFRLANGSLSDQERSVVLRSCLHWHGTRAWMHLIVVMPDHVHMLLRPMPPHSIPALMHSIKSFSSNEIQSMRGASGKLWQREYHDRIVRSATQLENTRRYIEENPVKDGLSASPGDYPYLWRQPNGRLEAAPPGPFVSPSPVEESFQSPTILTTSKGTLEGRIGSPPRVPAGANGFGYDPIFLVAPHHTHTSAELAPTDKNAISHRGNAARLMAQRIRSLLATHTPPQ